MDEVTRSGIHYQEHTGVLTHVRTQPTENLILERNAELRRNEGAIQDLGAQSGESWGRQIACIPEILLDWAVKHGFDIYNRDAKHAAKEMHRFLTTTNEGRSCLIREKI